MASCCQSSASGTGFTSLLGLPKSPPGTKWMFVLDADELVARWSDQDVRKAFLRLKCPRVAAFNDRPRRFFQGQVDTVRFSSLWKYGETFNRCAPVAVLTSPTLCKPVGVSIVNAEWDTCTATLQLTVRVGLGHSRNKELPEGCYDAPSLCIDAPTVATSRS